MSSSDYALAKTLEILHQNQIICCFEARLEKSLIVGLWLKRISLPLELSHCLYQAGGSDETEIMCVILLLLRGRIMYKSNNIDIPFL